MEFLCSACLELLNDPIILSCGNAVCKRCYRVKSVYYSCPVWNCQKTHQFRNEKPNTILREAIETLYPAEYSVFKLVESAERGLEEYLQDACNENLDNKEPVSLESILKSLGNAVEALPYLQLPYIVRAKVLMEMHEFDLALQDAQTAHKLNSWNQRGMVIEKIVNWRKAKYLANLNILSICALSELSSSNKSGNQSVSSENLPSELSLTLAELKNQVADARKTKSEPTLPLSSTFLNSSYQSIPNWGLTASIFECRICWSLLNDPVSAPCGHSWCRDCLVRSIEKSEFCPLCRCKLPSMGYVVCRPKSTVLEHIIGTAFGLSIEKQPPIAKDLIELPIFVCTLVFPHSKPSFHMFEPRYRAMVRKCVDEGSDFIITISDSDGKCKEYGSVCRITSYQAVDDIDLIETPLGLLPRYLIETSAIQVVKIHNTSMSKFGYLEGQVERIHDLEPDDIPDFDPKELESLVKIAEDFVRQLLCSIPPAARLAFQRQHGNQPDNKSEFSYWLAELLPLSPALLYTLLPISNVSERLKLIVSWIQAACKK